MFQEAAQVPHTMINPAHCLFAGDGSHAAFGSFDFWPIAGDEPSFWPSVTLLTPSAVETPDDASAGDSPNASRGGKVNEALTHHISAFTADPAVPCSDDARSLPAEPRWGRHPDAHIVPIANLVGGGGIPPTPAAMLSATPRSWVVAMGGPLWSEAPVRLALLRSPDLIVPALPRSPPSRLPRQCGRRRQRRPAARWSYRHYHNPVSQVYVASIWTGRRASNRSRGRRSASDAHFPAARQTSASDHWALNTQFLGARCRGVPVHRGLNERPLLTEKRRRTSAAVLDGHAPDVGQQEALVRQPRRAQRPLP